MKNIDFSTLYGVERNYKGTEERRYIYVGEQLIRMEKVTEADLDGLEGSFRSNDTYTICKIDSEEELKKFLSVAKEGICDCEDPSLRALRDTWSTLCMECMYTGEENETMARVLSIYGDDTRENRDPRYQKLLDLGMPEEDFFLNWPEEDAYRYHAVCESLRNGTYHELQKGLKTIR